MRAIIGIGFAKTKHTPTVRTTQRREQIIKANSNESRSLDHIHDRADTLTDRRVSNGKRLVNSRFRRHDVAHSVVLKTNHGVGDLTQAAERVFGLSSSAFPLERKWHRRECDDE